MLESINVITIFNARLVAATETETSNIVDFNAYMPANAFSMQIEVTGDGTCSVGYQLSNDGNDFATPIGVSALFTGLNKTTGGGAVGGKLIDEVSLEMGRYAKFYIEETGDANSVTVTIHLAVQ